MQGTRVQALVWEDPTCCRTTRPVSHNYWACALEPASHDCWGLHATTTEARVPRACAPQQEEPPQWEARTPQWRVGPSHRNWRKPACSNEDPTQPKINKFILKISKKKRMISLGPEYFFWSLQTDFFPMDYITQAPMPTPMESTIRTPEGERKEW